jgi:hypothetical protein
LRELGAQRAADVAQSCLVDLPSQAGQLTHARLGGGDVQHLKPGTGQQVADTDRPTSSAKRNRLQGLERGNDAWRT